MATKTQIMNEKNERVKEKAYHKALLIASEGELPPDRAVAIAIDCGWDAARASSPAVPSEAVEIAQRYLDNKILDTSAYQDLHQALRTLLDHVSRPDRQASDAVEKERERIIALLLQKADDEMIPTDAQVHLSLFADQLSSDQELPKIARGGMFAPSLRRLNVGESFLIPKEAFTNQMTTDIHSIAKRCGIKIKTRTEESGLRVWRVAKATAGEANTMNGAGVDGGSAHH